VTVIKCSYERKPGNISSGIWWRHSRCGDPVPVERRRTSLHSCWASRASQTPWKCPFPWSRWTSLEIPSARHHVNNGKSYYHVTVSIASVQNVHKTITGERAGARIQWTIKWKIHANCHMKYWGKKRVAIKMQKLYEVNYSLSKLSSKSHKSIPTGIHSRNI